MELQLEQQLITCLVPCVNRSIEERFSSDFIVPDFLPDASELLLSEGDLCIWRLDLSSGNAELEGEISARICFTNEDGLPESFSVSVPLLLRVRDEAIESGQRPFLRCRIKTMNAQLLNSRKVRIQGMVRCALMTYCDSEIDVTTGIVPDEHGIYERKAQMWLPYISAVEEQVFTTEEKLPLHRGAPFGGQLLSHASTAVVDYFECRDGHVMVKGRICTPILYRNADSLTVISETVETSFSGFLDVDSDVSNCRLSVHLTSEEIRCCNDEPAVETAFHLLVQAICYSAREIELVADAYCNCASMTLSWKNDSFPELTQYEAEKSTAAGEIPYDLTEKDVCAVRAAVRGESIGVTLLVQNQDQKGLSSLTTTLKTEFDADWLEQPSVSIDANAVQIQVPFGFRRESETLIPFHNLSAAELGDMIEIPISGISLVRREKNADLWELAKMNRSTVSAIQSANPDIDRERKWLVIPHVS